MNQYTPGHDMHFIHAGHVARTPWGWRPGIVTAYVDSVLTVDYVLEDGTIEIWHHQPVPVRLGDPVRVHEQYAALDVGGTWRSVAIRAGGIGAVPRPELPELWAAEVPSVVVDVARGHGLT